ncbi:MAG: FtsW/RodA/SpoVE family cell cycle protein, partial [Prevotellaceae bacterium]|nr:FtsW/RodA/SpoVE family cell cycle protein [Prevotellaceae bacterium]
MQQLGKYFKGDRTIWMIVLLLAIFSLLIVYSSTAAITGRASIGPFYYFTKQLMFFVAGFVLLYIIYLTPYQLFMAFTKIGFILSIVLLIITLILGSSYNQAVRTLFFFQPAEIAKIMLITYVAKQITVKQDKIKSFKEGFLPILMPVLLTCFLVFISNFSTAAIMGVICFIMMYIGRAKLRHLLGTIGVLLLALIIGMN